MKPNALFVGYKPMFMSSNHYLQRLKRRFGVKKAGYSGTLDPFAKGVLVVAFGHYTRLFDHLNQEPKVYRATLWLGLHSDSLDIENILGVEVIPPYSKERVEEIMGALEGEISYTPPKYCAKRIAGRRAYDMARNKEEVELPILTMRVGRLSLLHYTHPFVHFEAEVSKGSYIRSLGEMIASRLGCYGALSSLERLSEGEMRFEGYRELEPLEILPYPKIDATSLKEEFLHGKKLLASDLGNPKEGKYIAEFEEFFSIIEIKEGQVVYLLNRMEKC